MAVGPAAAPPPPRAHYDAPYRLFLGTSLALALFGGFLLAVLLPLAQALNWGWGARWQALVQAHGQLQLLGFAGLFIAGMALRLMPRFSGRDLAFPYLVPALIPLIGGSVVLRALAQPWGSGALRDAGLALSAALLLAGALAFAAVVWATLLQRESRAEATAWYFSFGALAYIAQAALNAAVVVEMVRHDLALAPLAKDDMLIFVQLFGFVLLFLSGVATRAVPSLTGNPRPDAPSRAAAAALAAGVALYAVTAAWAAYHAPAGATARAEDAALLLIAAAFVAIIWLSGVVRPRANRVARASQTSFLFVRAAFLWLFVAAVLMVWYGVPALADGRPLDAYATDAIRHTVTVGVVTMMIVGMGMLVIPEFAGRRIQHPGGEIAVLAMLTALNAAAALRIWPAIEGLRWLSMTRFWPMAAAGALAIAAVAAFALMFLQSYIEQRTPGWGSADALRRGRAPRA
ncbi:MAG: NnrS family protein [Chloroflexota bacterium]|nr:NnrS family protein [Chloroflexota bacterium]